MSAEAKDSQPVVKDINPIYEIWNIHKPFTIPSTSFKLTGFSIAAHRTNFMIKDLGIMFDAGLSCNITPELLLLTHTHSDHSANLPFHLYSSVENKKVEVYCHSVSKNKFANIIETNYQLSADEVLPADASLEHYNLNLVEFGDVKEITIRGKKFKMEIIQCFHTVTTVGYGLTEITKKLKEEYKQQIDNKTITGKDIAAMRKAGVEVNCEHENSFYLYLGDTGKEVLLDKRLEKYSTIQIECTFIMDDEIDRAEKTGHMHIKSLVPYIIAHPNIFFVLYHFSQRYRPSEIRAFFDKLNLPNVMAWIS